MKKSLFGFALLLLSFAAAGAELKPKYGSEATVLSESHEALKKNPSPDFWALIPYYVPQRDGRSCSVASISMVVNAARVGMHLTSEEELVTQDGLLKKVGNDKWSRGVGALGRGVILDDLGEFVRQSLEAYGLKVVSLEIVHADLADAGMKSRLHQALVENERSSKDFIIANFDQKVFTNDASAGHIAPVAAYDAARKSVLILDPDRQWYEPYWVSEETFLRGMATRDSETKKNRGYVRVKVQ